MKKRVRMPAQLLFGLSLTMSAQACTNFETECDRKKDEVNRCATTFFLAQLSCSNLGYPQAYSCGNQYLGAMLACSILLPSRCETEDE
jgi:hypothetical protein